MGGRRGRDVGATRYRQKMRPGDLVALWSSGAEAGVYALAELTGVPFEDHAPAWMQPTEEQTSWHVPLRLTRALEVPLLRTELKEHPILRNLQIMRNAQGTNFEVTEPEWEALAALIDTPSTPPPGRRRST